MIFAEGKVIALRKRANPMTKNMKIGQGVGASRRSRHQSRQALRVFATV